MASSIILMTQDSVLTTPLYSKNCSTHSSAHAKDLGSLSVYQRKTVVLSNVSPSTNISINQQPLENVTSFKYLGSNFTSQGHLDADIKLCITRTVAKLGSLSTNCWDKYKCTSQSTLNDDLWCVCIQHSPLWGRRMGSISETAQLLGCIHHAMCTPSASCLMADQGPRH